METEKKKGLNRNSQFGSNLGLLCYAFLFNMHGLGSRIPFVFCMHVLKWKLLITRHDNLTAN